MRNVRAIVFVCVFAARLPGQTPTITSIANGADFAAGPIAPRELLYVFGTGLGPAALVTCAIPWPVSCGGTSVLINGEAAPIYLASATQINIEAPLDLAGSTAAIQVTVAGQLSSPTVTVPVASTAPGIFSIPQDNLTIGLFQRADQSIISASNPAVPGDELIFYGTGFGLTNPADVPGSALMVPVTVSAGSLPAPVAWAGASALGPGSDEVSFTVPMAVPAGNLSVVISAGGQAAHSVLLPVVLAPVISDIRNAASGAAGIESGSWFSIFGGALSATTRSWQPSDFAGGNLPLMLDGVRVTVNGKPAAISYISPVQLNVQAPADTSTGAVEVEVSNIYGEADGTATLQLYAPGFFTFQNQYAAAVHADGTNVAPVGYFGDAAASRPAQPGELISIFGTGFGPTNPAVTPGEIVTSAAPLSEAGQLQVSISGFPATVQFAGIVAPGEYQLNVYVPQLADGDQPIIASISGFSSQTGLAIPVMH